MKSSFRSRHLLAATLLISGGFALAQPVGALLAPGTSISNTATATFTDSGTGNTFNATSNTVTVQVAEVPGISVTAQTPSNATPNAGDTVDVDFVITNIGNDPTQFFIPDTVTFGSVTGPTPTLSGPLKIIAVNATGTSSTTVDVSIPTGGAATGPNENSYASLGLGPIAPGGSVTVRARVQIAAAAQQNDTFTVSLGNTTPANADNAPLPAGNISAGDLFTVDNPNSATNETAGNLNTQTTPVIKEAMDTSTAITVAAKLQAYASVLKANGGYSNNSTPAILTDDFLTYSLALTVKDPTVTGIATTNLFGTAISVNGSTVARVLISDAIPANTVLATTDPTATEANWQVVYTTSDLSIPAHDALWVTTRPPTGTITRVGFIFDAGTTGITKGSTVSGFRFQVTPSSGFSGGQISNIAQVFGQSQSSVITTGVPANPIPGTPTQLVYDESGDQTANNGLGTNNPDTTTVGNTITIATGGISTGVADPVADDVDPGPGNDPTVNSNTGTNQGTDGDPDGGEVTVFTIAAAPLNGPLDQPAAEGTTGNTNNDFTNKSISLPANLNPTTALTDAQTTGVTFSNTVQNTSSSVQTISLLPTPPATPTALPIGTIVRVTAGTANTDVAIYRYDGTAFVWQASGIIDGVTVNSVNTSATDPVQLVDIPVNDNAANGTDEVDYTVTVDLPGGLPQFTGYSVPITAFVDQDNSGTPNNEPNNITLDQVYTGYIRLTKTARILDTNGTTELAPFSETPPTGLLLPGRFIEYRIQYSNVTTGGGTGNIGLTASNMVITEDGTAGGNNWALDQDSNAVIDTSHVSGFAATSGTIIGTITYFAGNPTTTAITDAAVGTTAASTVTRYVNTLNAPLAPGQSGTFIFRRRLNGDPIPLPQN
jgi:hypothetical protein